MPLNKILLRGPNWVGDAVLAIPAMKAVRAGFPDAEITLLVRPWVAGVFHNAPFIDTVWTEPRPAGVADWARIVREMRRRRFDAGLLFPNSFESAAMFFLAGIPERAGYAADGRGWLLTRRIARSAARQHQAYYYLKLADVLSGKVEHAGGDRGADTRIEPGPDAQVRARHLLASEGVPKDRRFMVLNPGAAYGSAKRWKEDRFAEAADALAREFGFAVVIVGSETERSIAENVRMHMKSPAVALNGRTSLETLVGLLSLASLVLTNDSGPMHIAAALGAPTVAVFGATDDAATGPLGRLVRVVKEPVECSPCLLRECPIDHRCMTRVSAESVCRAARELL